VVAGLELQRFAGPQRWEAEQGPGVATDLGFSGGLRGGLELFRTHATRATCHLQLNIPAFKSRDVDSGVVDHWVPTMSVGVGLLL